MNPFMNQAPLCIKQLSPHHKEQISHLVSICSIQDQSRMSYPFEEEECCVHFLLYQQGLLTSALCLFFPSEDLCECTAFTHPNFRRQGQFTALLDEAERYLEQRKQLMNVETEFYFVAGSLTKQLCNDTLGTLQSLDAEYLYSEYMMNCPLNHYKNRPNPSPGLQIIHAERIDGGFSCLFKDKQEIIGRCEWQNEADKAYIHHVEINQNLRNKGYGTDFLRLLLWQLYCKNLTVAFLQVSSTNQPAMALYKKTGFQICEILSYWLW